MPLPILGILGALVKPITGLIDDMHTSDEEKAQAKAKLLALAQDAEKTLVEAQSRIIEAEAKSGHWITSAWRPLIMLMFGAIIANNYIIAPYLQLFIGKSIVLPLPPDLWALLKIGIGGYVVGRSGEKIVNVWKSK